jgi:hypothetical protein
MSVEEAMQLPHGFHNRNGTQPRTYEFRGEQKTAKEIAAITGQCLAWVYRHSDGSRIIEPAKLDTYTHAGITDTLKGWAKHTGINYTTLRNRLHTGWTFERAITTPAMSIFSPDARRQRIAACFQKQEASQ